MLVLLNVPEIRKIIFLSIILIITLIITILYLKKIKKDKYKNVIISTHKNVINLGEYLTQEELDSLFGEDIFISFL